MSVNYDLKCYECDKRLWIGQAGLSGFTFYTGEPKTMAALKEFLWEHQGHRLEFNSDLVFGDEEDPIYPPPWPDR